VRLERGLGYLFRGPTGGIVELMQALRPKRMPLLWITAREAESGPPEAEILRVTSLQGAMRTVQPGRLADLRAAAGAFLDEHSGGCIVLDAIDVLVVHNGVERVLRAIEALHDDVATRGGHLVVCVDAGGVNPRLLAWLDRELDASLDLAAIAAAPGPLSVNRRR
jgi:hypothetical protein